MDGLAIFMQMELARAAQDALQSFDETPQLARKAPSVVSWEFVGYVETGDAGKRSRLVAAA